ncbi:hypothetical protein NA56DRAFT_701640 [Hyaloscypha hepaticicola]|uniref:Uncharacterized protein n=1 Tax=Hyaloscypha hepaticicola TaxID=2082293 RepID=A0A2J6QAQ2_9HELO|nr:hypothetical protein NA56DRAFT_701640 [Hyaloscypha hepaticicola]
MDLTARTDNTAPKETKKGLLRTYNVLNSAEWARERATNPTPIIRFHVTCDTWPGLPQQEPPPQQETLIDLDFQLLAAVYRTPLSLLHPATDQRDLSTSLILHAGLRQQQLEDPHRTPAQSPVRHYRFVFLSNLNGVRPTLKPMADLRSVPGGLTRHGTRQTPIIPFKPLRRGRQAGTEKA